jgi:hypothetical protein
MQGNEARELPYRNQSLPISYVGSDKFSYRSQSGRLSDLVEVISATPSTY